MQLQHIKAVVFDLDGTLVDSRLNFNAMCDDIGWPRGTAILEQLALTSDAAEIARIENIIRQHEMAGAQTASWMPGAEQCLQLLLQAGMPLALLTRNMRDATQLTLQRLQIPIERVLTREDCAAKPSPEGLHIVASELGIEAAQLLYVGDYIFDLQTAANAGAVSCLYLNDSNQHFVEQADWAFCHFDELAAAFKQRVV